MKNKENVFFKQTLKSELNISAVYTIHYFKYGKNFRFREESHNFYELVYLDSGHAIVSADDKILELEQGQAFLHKPNENHTIYTNDKSYNTLSYDTDSFTVKITQSNCPNHDCVDFFELNSGNGVIYCLPHGLKIVPLSPTHSEPSTGGRL